MKASRIVSLVLTALLAATTTLPAQETRPVDVVVVLDTSGSMENLLDATRARLWDVVNELGRMQPTPELRVGLISFGTDKATEDDGFIIQHVDLTDELDEVYAELMELTIGGGDEFVGRALNEAIDGMGWSPEWDALRIVFVAGNEPADQGDEDFRVAAQAARDRDIIVNALYAGNREQGVVEKWPEIARAGEGNFSAIDPAIDPRPRLLGPAPAPIARLRGKYRYHLLMVASELETLRAAVRQVSSNVETPDDIQWIVLLVLINQPGQEAAFTVMQDMVYDGIPDLLH